MSLETKISIFSANKVNKSPMTLYRTFVAKYKYQFLDTLIEIKVISGHQVIKVKQIGKSKIGYRDAIPTWF